MGDLACGFISVALNGTDGSIFTQLTAQPCTSVEIINAPADIDVGAFGVAGDGDHFVTVPSGASQRFRCVGNSGELAVRRNDKATTATKVRALWNRGNPELQA